MTSSRPSPDPVAALRQRRLRQPDQRSCGPACLVVARLLLDPRYADRLAGEQKWQREVLETHRRVTGAVDGRGTSQMPWPRALGTPPWAMARELSAMSTMAGRGLEYRTRLVGRRARAFALLAQADSDAPVGLYVGSRLLPRHVLLAVAATPDVVSCYEPSRGTVIDLYRQAFVAGELRLVGWDRPWLLVAPREAAGRMTA